MTRAGMNLFVGARHVGKDDKGATNSEEQAEQSQAIKEEYLWIRHLHSIDAYSQTNNVIGRAHARHGITMRGNKSGGPLPLRGLWTACNHQNSNKYNSQTTHGDGWGTGRERERERETKSASTDASTSKRERERWMY